MSKYKSWRYWRDEWVKPILYALVIALFIRTFVVQPFKIPTSSMVPTFMPGDRIFVNKFIYGAKVPFTNISLPKLREPIHGDIIVFRSPVEPKKYLVKRLVGLPGDSVEIKDNHVWINGKLIKTPLSIAGVTYYNRGKFGAAGESVKIPENSYFALGDNSLNSVDSRYWGFVPEKNLAGKVFLIHWPPKRIRVIK
ncbi:MAG: signal peptidase I [Candidatus Omnitrophica bacterium]|nr:signal peptidase I [Candidatus Omnitrophota bacterium]